MGAKMVRNVISTIHLCVGVSTMRVGATNVGVNSNTFKEQNYLQVKVEITIWEIIHEKSLGTMVDPFNRSKRTLVQDPLKRRVMNDAMLMQ